MRNSATDSPSVQARHELSDVYAPGVWLTGLGLVLCTILIMLMVVSMFHGLQRGGAEAARNAASGNVVQSVSTSVETFPGARLQVRPRDDLATLRAWEDDELNHYGWIDKSAGVVRLPVDRAMDLIAQRGLPVRGQPGAPAPTRTVLDMQQARPSDWRTPATQTK